MIKKLVVSILLISLVLVVSGCIAGQNTKENAEAVAQDFAIKHHNSNWEELYELFTPELKTMRSKESFVNYISKKGLPAEGVYLIFDKVVMQGDNEAYAYYTLSSGVLDAKMPPMRLVFTSEGWRVDGSASYFTDEACLDRDDDGHFLLLEEECKDLQISKCGDYGNIDDVTSCFLTLAMQYDDETLCDEFDNFRNQLYGIDKEKFDTLLFNDGVFCRAVITENQDLCLNMESESSRGICLNYFE